MLNFGLSQRKKNEISRMYDNITDQGDKFSG